METQSMKKVAVSLFFTVLIIVAFLLGTRYGYQNKMYAQAVSALFGDDVSVPNIDLSPYLKAWNIIDEKYVFDDKPDNQERVWGSISGLVGSVGDPYTVFLPPQEAETFEEDIAGKFGGVGIEIGVQDNIVTVISPLVGSPADKAGLKAQDKIIAVDGEPTQGIGIDGAVARIRGDIGTSVTLTVLRDGEAIDISVVRDIIRIPTIDAEVIDGVFVIRLYNFSADSVSLFENALREFRDSHTNDKLIIDLRGNPGGFLNSAVDMASYFLPQGAVIVRENYGEGREENETRSSGIDFFDEDPEVVVLVDGGSASASEILAAALSENGYATVVGSRTFGKGSVQELVPVTSNTYVKITVAKWLTPDGRSIQDEGIAIDREVLPGEVEGEDPQLDAALDIIGGVR